MKLNKILLSLCIMLVSYVIHAQTQKDKMIIRSRTNVAGLIQMSKRLESEHEKNLQKALQYARSKNWPLVKKIGGGTGYLMGITQDLKPVYYQTLNAGAAATSRADRLYA